MSNEMKVVLGCSEGSARVYEDWSAFGADYVVLDNGDEMEVSILNTDIENLPAPLYPLVADLIQDLKENWKAVSIGANDSGPFSVVDGTVWVRNTTPFKLEVVVYVETDPWADDDMSDHFSQVVEPNAMFEAPIVHSNAQTLWIRKVV